MSDTTVKRARAVKRSLKPKINQRIKALMADDPLAAGLKARVDVRVYREKPAGYHAYPRTIVAKLLSDAAFRRMSNAEIANYWSKTLEGFPVSQSIMTTPLKGYQRKEVEIILKDRDFKIDLKFNNTLSKIKKAISGANFALLSSRVYTVSVSFAEDTVVVNGTPYPIVTKGRSFPSVRTAVGWLRCDLLESLLKPSS